MRYIVQFVVPALIVLAIVYAFARGRRNAPRPGDSGGVLSDGGIVLVVLIGSALAVALVVAMNS